ncbi:Alpha/Beta hydrolase protein [Zopfochytrium polystomum]|nr:Alpha/Beta hydrolase protein [Zopfochytrium polystomum]
MVRSARKPAEKAVQAFVAKFEGTKQAEMITAPSPASLEFVAETTFPVRIPWNLTHIKNTELEQAGGEKAQRFLQLDIIRKQTGYKGRPILLNIHGGAWKAVDKSARMARYWTLASKENWVIVNINYRLAPSVNLFEMIGDCKKALRWVRQNPHIHGGDTTFVAVSGESAGGHLATLVAFTQNDPSFQRGWEQVDTSIQACIPVYGVMEPLGPLAVHPLAKGLRGFFSNEIVRMTDTESRAATGRPAIEWADPMGVLQAIPLEARGKLPPTFIIHGDVDTLVLVEHSRKFYEELKRGDAVAAGYLEVPGRAPRV